MDVDHGAHHFAPLKAEFPLFICMIVNPERHSQKEDKVGKNQVKYSSGGGGRCAGFHDVHHEAQANGPTDENHRIDDQEGCVVFWFFCGNW